MPVDPIPKGYPRMATILVVEDLGKALDWYRDVLGMEETMRLQGPDGRPMHGELKLGESVVMVGEQTPAMKAFAPPHYGGSPSSIVAYVTDVDAALANAVKAGATLERPAADMPWGDRMGSLSDPFGHVWHLTTHIEDVTQEEINRRMSQMKH